jgi:GTPase Era involved in 16S rRNA processing
MLSFLRLLKQRYESILSHLPTEDGARGQVFRHNLQSLAFAEAFFEKGELNAGKSDHPPQIAVLGPTQAGKSSVINWLLGQNLAEVSPLAGFTVHPQGFCSNVPAERIDWIDAYFSRYRRCRPGDLPNDRYDCFVLEETAADPRSPLKGTVLWDTPDFDSVDAEGYRQAVLRVAALADVVLLVLSKDKYADLSVWELMALLEPLAQPTVVCLNKVEPSSYPTLAESLRRKWQSSRRDQPPPVIAVPYLEEIEADGLASLTGEREQVLGALHHAIRSVHRNRQARHAGRLLNAHWQNWLAPVKAEHGLAQEWRTLIAETVRDSLTLYRRDYLNHPHHYETFQRALAELLRLLEVPGLAGTLLAARQIVTWPLRQIVRLGQSVVRKGYPAAKDGEAAILNQALEHLFVRVGETILLKRDEERYRQDWWRELGNLLRNDKPILTSRFETGIEHYLRAFQPEIDKTARGLYDHLKEHPAVLNSLRATRATTDAAALAVALHTGGIGVQDFIIAPAILSLTSLLAESALGHYVDRASAELKEKQAKAVQRLFEETIYAHLIRFPGRLDESRRFNIAPETVAAIEKQLA